MTAVEWTRADDDRLAAAKLWAISPSAGDLPYLATALYALATVPTVRVPDMATDLRWRLYVNPGWLATADTDDVGRALVHQVWHLLADHAGRAQSLEVGRSGATAWRTATDVTIGEVVPWPEHGLPAADELGLPRGRAAEEYYAALSGLPAAEPDSASGAEGAGGAGGGGGAGDANGAGGADGAGPAAGHDPDAAGCGSGCDGIPRPYELLSGDDRVPALDSHVAEALRKQTARAFRDHCRAVGLAPGDWRRWVEEILDPVVPWHQVLHAAVRRGLGWGQGQTDYTYSRVSRRQAVAGAAILPALRRPMPGVVLVIDTSGSVDDHLMAQALGEVDAVLASLAVPGSSVTTMAVDAAVHSVARVRDARDIRLAGGGGTDMAAGIAEALRTRPPPHLIIVLTDGYTPWPAAPAPVPVVAAVLGRQRAALPRTPWWTQRVEVVAAP